LDREIVLDQNRKRHPKILPGSLHDVTAIGFSFLIARERVPEIIYRRSSPISGLLLPSDLEQFAFS
jgi:hypothetical protein